MTADEVVPEVEAMETGDDVVDGDDERKAEVARAAAAQYKEQGNAKYKEKDYYVAIDLYNKAIESDPDNGDYYNNRAAAEMMLGLTKKGIVSCKECLKRSPKNVKALIRLGKLQVKAGLADEALLTFRSALEIDPTNGNVLKEKRDAELLSQRIKAANDSMRKGDFQRALALAQAGLRQAPECWALNLIHTRGLIKAGDYDKAYGITTKLMRENQRDADLLFYRAQCLYYQENFASAIRHLQQALSLDPDNKAAATEIRKIKKLEKLKESGNAAIKRYKFQEAADAYSQGLEVDPDNKLYNAKLYCNRSLAFLKLKKIEEALADSEKAVALNADYGKAYLRRAQCLRALGGKDNLERAMHSYHDAERIFGRTDEIRQSMQETKIELKKAKRKDYYKILSLPNKEDSSDAEIKKAYKKAALKWHPDRHANSSEEEKIAAENNFKDVGEAYEVLSNPEKRRKYDAGQTLEEIEQGGGFGDGIHMDHADIFQMFMGGGMGRGGHHGHPFGGGGHSFHFG